MELLEAIHTRRSVRSFEDREIPLDVIREILEAGVRAPNGGNRQPWRFVVVRDRAKIAKFDPIAHQACVEKAPAVLVACADPHDTWDRYDENDQCWLLDTCAAIQNMLLAMHDRGLGAVWVITFSKHAVRALAGIPKHWQIVSIVPFGWPAAETTLTARRPLEEVAFLDSPDGLTAWES
ncbi:MAG: nitroreductase family protein [Planctomycetota bacterium]